MIALVRILGAVAAAAPPNILFILADDLGYGDVSTYPNPSSIRLETPRLAQLAKEGTMFTQAYAGYSVCAPSRRTLMTGYHTGHFTALAQGVLLSSKSVTIAHILRDAGYKTKLIGKWGLDGNYQEPRPPQQGFPTLQGFEEFYGQSDQWQCHDYYPSFMFNGTSNFTIAKNVGSSVQKCGTDFAQCTWSADLWTADAVSWISEKSAEEAPWFLYLAYTSPHAGAVGSVGEDDVPGPRLSASPYASEDWPGVEKDFANTVTLVDHAVGEVVDAVDAAGAKSNTVVFFSSDNGAHSEGGHSYRFFNSSGFLNGFKRSIHDGGHRAAFIVRWPGTTPAGSVSDHQLCFYDFLPTAAALAGVSNSVPPSIDGHSFDAVLRGEAQAQPAFIYHEYDGCDDPSLQAYPGLSKAFGQNIRMGSWSGVCVGPSKPCSGNNPPESRFFLYNMSSDEGQQVDLASAYPDVAARILAVMRSQFNYSWDPATRPQPPPPPFPGPHPRPSPCDPNLTGSWWGLRNNSYSATMQGKLIALATDEACCKWVNASGSVDGATIRVTAHGSGGFTLKNVGSVSADFCSITWSERWAPWRKQL